MQLKPLLFLGEAISVRPNDRKLPRRLILCYERPYLTPMSRAFASRGILLVSALSGVILWGTPHRASADKHHEVRSGQTLSTIARRYHVSVSALASANGLTSETLLKQGTTLRVPARGQKINAKRPQGRQSAINLYRVCTKERLRLRVLDEQGRARKAARTQLARLLRPRGSKRTHLPHPRLLQLLSRVSTHFDGRTLVVISGYRTPGNRTSKTSKHTQGRAIDFKIEGISNRVLRDYLRTLPNVGVGYYPRSSFVHLDVRAKPAYWVDWAGPGEAPIFEKRRQARDTEVESNGAEDDAIELESSESEIQPPSQDSDDALRGTKTVAQEERDDRNHASDSSLLREIPDSDRAPAPVDAP